MGADFDAWEVGVTTAALDDPVSMRSLAPVAVPVPANSTHDVSVVGAEAIDTTIAGTAQGETAEDSSLFIPNEDTLLVKLAASDDVGFSDDGLPCPASLESTQMMTDVHETVDPLDDFDFDALEVPGWSS